MRSECHAIFPKKSRKRASYVVGRLVAQAIECSIVRQRQFSFLGTFEIFVARKRSSASGGSGSISVT
jgi:hypothetical protein